MFSILFLCSHGASSCKSRVVALSRKAVLLTDATFIECTNPVQIKGRETITTITSCQFRSCKSAADNAGIGFYGLGLVVLRSNFVNCETTGKCSAIGATRFSLLSPPPWQFDENEVMGCLCETATCRFEGLPHLDGRLSILGDNITHNRAKLSASMIWIESLLSITTKFCRFDSNWNHNGIVLDHLPDQTNLSFIVFSSNRCSQTNRSSINGLFYISAVTTLRDSLFVQNAVDCLVSSSMESGSQLLRFEGCVFDVRFGRAAGCGVTIVTTNCTIAGARARRILAPWPNPTLPAVRATRTRNHRTRLPSRTPPLEYGRTGEDDGLSGWAIFGIVVAVLVGCCCCCYGAWYVLCD
jgi:hypothetical protein